MDNMDKMPEDLRRLAENVSEWPEGCEWGAWLTSREGQKETTGFHGWPKSIPPMYHAAYTKDQWQTARQQLEDDRMDRIGQNGNDGAHYDVIMTEEEESEYGPPTRSKYHVEIRPGVWVDVYDVLHAFGVTNPGDQHAIKKMLMPGKRGVKSANQDRREAIASLERAVELERTHEGN